MSRPNEPIRAVLFDLDGTLVDSAPDLREALNALLRAIGRRQVSLEETIGFVGDGAAKLVEPASETALPDLVSRFLRLYSGANAIRKTTVFPGAQAMLSTLRARGLRLAICTNKPFRPAAAVLSALKLDGYFDEVLGGDSLPQRKPDPAPALELARRLGVAPASALFVGDSEIDAQAARAAGMRFVAVSFGYAQGPVGALRAERVIDALDDLPTIIDALARPRPSLSGLARAGVSDGARSARKSIERMGERLADRASLLRDLQTVIKNRRNR